MPNHFHAIVVLLPLGEKRKPLGRLIGAFKTRSTRLVNEQLHTPGAVLWQRNYYEHVIRSDKALDQCRDYILLNPYAAELRTGADEYPWIKPPLA